MPIQEQNKKRMYSSRDGERAAIHESICLNL